MEEGEDWWRLVEVGGGRWRSVEVDVVGWRVGSNGRRYLTTPLHSSAATSKHTYNHTICRPA